MHGVVCSSFQRTSTDSLFQGSQRNLIGALSCFEKEGALIGELMESKGRRHRSALVVKNPPRLHLGNDLNPGSSWTHNRNMNQEPYSPTW